MVRDPSPALRDQNDNANGEGTHEPRRPSRIFRKERERISSRLRPVASASFSVIAPHAIPRRKKLSSPWPVAASSKTSPKSEASAAFSTKVFKRFEALSRLPCKEW